MQIQFLILTYNSYECPLLHTHLKARIFVVPALCTLLILYVWWLSVTSLSVFWAVLFLPRCRRSVGCQSQHGPSVTQPEPGNYLAWRSLPVEPHRVPFTPYCINDFGHWAEGIWRWPRGSRLTFWGVFRWMKNQHLGDLRKWFSAGFDLIPKLSKL